jgi:hypothetical protein
VEWLVEAADGDVLIVFDECHRAKNLVTNGGASTKTGVAVLALQNALPNARRVACGVCAVVVKAVAGCRAPVVSACWLANDCVDVRAVCVCAAAGCCTAVPRARQSPTTW